MAFVALFDANVLYPAPLRDLLIRLARTGLFRARWSEKINDEWTNALLRTRPELADRLPRTRALLNSAIDDCLVEGYETLIPALTLPDPDDRHVLAAAIVGGADVIVTLNIRDFPAERLAPFRIDAQHPDKFIRHTLDLDEAVAFSAVREARGALKTPPKTVEDFLDTLAQQGLAESVAFLRARSGLL
ncbi:PIN domain-containing protein [Acidisoma cellulosilyticum]|uniref:PIN domain-containing protein n=1 Tax=Acidisoma cellulosilyticum TaxID=2802395 RepID=UPI001D0B0FA5|nr:PIN domain-containing protein [Acidisoma cellulosilyticum]